jgi:DHA2 family multidrug resistance protein
MNATQNGNLFMPSALAAMLFMPVVAILMGKFDPRFLMLLGVGFTAVTLVMMGHMTPQTGYWNLFWPLMWRSLGTALLFIPVNTVALAAFKDAELGQAAGVVNLSRQIGGSASTAILNTISNNSSNAAYEHMRQFISPLNAQFMNWSRTAQGTVNSLTSQIGLAHPDLLMVRSIYYKVKAQSFVMGFDQLCWWMLAVFMVSLVPIYFLKMPKGVKPGAVGMH